VLRYVAYPECIGRVCLEVSLYEVRVDRTFGDICWYILDAYYVCAFYSCLPRTSLTTLFLEQWMSNLNGSFRMDPRCSIGAAAPFMDLLDVSEEDPILYRMI